MNSNQLEPSNNIIEEAPKQDNLKTIQIQETSASIILEITNEIQDQLFKFDDIVNLKN